MNERYLRRMVRQALREDIGTGDITTHLTVDPGSRCAATLRAKSDGVLSGTLPFRMVFDVLKARLEDWDCAPDGTAFSAGDVLGHFRGPTRATLSGERTALNFAQRLSGVATQTARFVKAIEGLETRIVDTRKTTPLYRELEKEAVLHGGGSNHRHGLFDAILIKDNHIEAAGGIEAALSQAKAGKSAAMDVEIEVSNLDECARAVASGADIVMLDNMGLEEMAEAVKTHAQAATQFEASGNVTLETVRAVAETGVDIISVGALTHSAPAADLSLKIEVAP